MPIYAQPGDLITGAWVDGDTPPDNATRLLRYASDLVTDACKCDLYDTDDSGVPTDTVKSNAMRDATCCHAAMWSIADIDPGGGVVGREIAIQSQSGEGGNVAYADPVKAEEIQESLEKLSRAAWLILRQNGLATGRVWKNS